MINEFVGIWYRHKGEIREAFRQDPPHCYSEVVRPVVQIIHDHTEYDREAPDPDRIEVIDHGDYQGVLIFVIGGSGYQPHHYWYVKINYGSCSGCDALRNIKSMAPWDAEEPTEEQLNAYTQLALHIIQGLKEM